MFMQTTDDFAGETNRPKLEIQFGEETRCGVPIRQIRRTSAALFSRIMRRPWLSSAFVRSRLRNVIVKHGNLIKIPIGFQDETGFHFGVEPAE